MNTQDAHDNAGVVGRPPITYAVSMLAGHFIDIYVPLALPGGDERVMAGRIISALSFALFLWSVPLFKRYGTSVKPYRPTSAIIKTGPYRFSRNPIYLGLAVSLLGAALFLEKVLQAGVELTPEADAVRRFGVLLAHQPGVQGEQLPGAPDDVQRQARHQRPDAAQGQTNRHGHRHQDDDAVHFLAETGFHARRIFHSPPFRLRWSASRTRSL